MFVDARLRMQPYCVKGSCAWMRPPELDVRWCPGKCIMGSCCTCCNRANCVVSVVVLLTAWHACSATNSALSFRVWWPAGSAMRQVHVQLLHSATIAMLG